MKLSQVALQLYTLRDFTTTEAAHRETLRRVAALGYPAVEVGTGALPPREVASLCRDLGLTISACGFPPLDLLADPSRAADAADQFGCRQVTYAFPVGFDLGRADDVTRLIDSLNRAGSVLAQRGKFLAYHNHNNEFRRVDGRVALERIFAETDPALVKAELDTYWIQYGGGNPVSWCQHLRGRLPSLHLKDYATGPDNQPTYAEIGNGLLEWPAIIREAEASGCQWFVVEQDTCPGDPFVSVQQSLHFIRHHLIR